jgi:hypothetical protein
MHDHDYIHMIESPLTPEALGEGIVLIDAADWTLTTPGFGEPPTTIENGAILAPLFAGSDWHVLPGEAVSICAGGNDVIFGTFVRGNDDGSILVEL